MPLISSLLLAGALTAQPATTPNTAPPPRPIVDCEQLRPYVATDYRCRVVMNYEAGISQLRRYVESGRPELAFIYVPNTNEWFEAGLESEERKVTLDVAFLNEMILEHKTIVRLHTHPVTRTGLDQTFQDIEDAIPSAGDLRNMIFATALAYTHDPERYVFNNIVSSFGTTAYDATEMGKAGLTE